MSGESPEIRQKRDGWIRKMRERHGMSREQAAKNYEKRARELHKRQERGK
jgi:hypothetical protein